MSKQIPLGGSKYPGLSAIVDDMFYDWLIQFSWHPVRGQKTFYAATDIRRDGKWHSVSMHRLIMDADPGQQIDHIDGNGLDNRLCNLRFATKAQNAMNRSRRITSPSKYKGVHKDTKGRWHATIGVGGKHIHLGSFGNQHSAALAYNAAAIQYHGEFARLNDVPLIPDDDDPTIPLKRAANGPKKSVHKGVVWDGERQKWIARLGAKHLGRFDTEQAALERIKQEKGT